MLEPINALGNIEIDKKQNYVLISLNPSLYPVHVVLAAAEKLMSRACIILDGDPAEEILVEIRPKGSKEDLKKLAFDFNNQLINALRNKKK